MKKLLTLFTLLLTVCSGAWADNTASSPATTTHKVGDTESQVFLDVANTISNATITEGKIKCLSYGALYLANSLKPAWMTDNSASKGSSSYTYGTALAEGFLAIGSSSSVSTGYGYVQPKSGGAVTFYVTGITGVAILGKNQGDQKKVQLSVETIAADGTATSAGAAVQGTNKSNPHVVNFGSALTSSSFYRITIDGTTEDKDYFYQIRFTQPSAPASYTVTYNANGGSGTIANSTGTDITLSDGTGFTAPVNYSFAGWNTANDGSGTSYAAGQTNVNADLDLFATWTQDGTIDANTGSANTTYTATLNATSIAIAAAPTKDGHVINGYYTAATDGTKVANADGTLVASTSYADEDGKWNNSAAAPTLYAQWGDPDYVFTPTGTISDTSLSKGDEVESSTGGKMEFTGTDGTLKYTDAGLEFGSKSACQVTVTLDRLMQVGTKISVTLYNTNDDKERGLVLKNISGTERATMTEKNKQIEFTKTYTVVADDGLAGSNQFVLQRSNNTYLRKVVVTNCVQPKEITITDLSKIDGSTYTGKNYATLYYSDVALAVPSGVKAYTYKMDGEALVVSRTYENGGTYPVIPAGEAVVVESDAGASYNFNVSTTETTVDTNSLLEGTDASTTIDESGYKYYKLAMNDALTSVGFYFAVDGGTSITNGAHKAYLRVSTTASKEYFVLGGEGVEEPQNETDGINAVDIAIANGATIYNLAGQKVGANYKGIVVINGKKVVRK